MRCFVSLEISEEIREKTAKIQENLRFPGIKLAEKQNLHFTLKFLGEISQETASKAAQLLGEIDFCQFGMDICGVGAFPNARHPRIIWVGCASPKITHLAAEIDAKLLPLGFPLQENYVSHMTIARVKPGMKGEKRRALSGVMEQLETICIGNMTAGTFCLKQSRLTPKMPVYSDVARFRLSV